MCEDPAALSICVSCTQVQDPQSGGSRTSTRYGTSAVIQADRSTREARQQNLTKASIHLHRSNQRQVGLAEYAEALAHL